MKANGEHRPAEATAHFGKMIEFPVHQEALVPFGFEAAGYLGRGEARLALGDAAGAHEDLVLAEYRSAAPLEATLLKGKAVYLLGLKQRAEEIFQRAHANALFPDAVALFIGNLYKSLGDLDKRLEWAGKVKSESAREFRYMQVYWERGELGKAEDAA
ncbi:MAG: hypothetical protein HY717_18280 [Planctomycetes bacterium]|nr:hypothetical protein [Planctomycetota bacterium]